MANFRRPSPHVKFYAKCPACGYLVFGEQPEGGQAAWHEVDWEDFSQKCNYKKSGGTQMDCPTLELAKRQNRVEV